MVLPYPIPEDFRCQYIKRGELAAYQEFRFPSRCEIVSYAPGKTPLQKGFYKNLPALIVVNLVMSLTIFRMRKLFYYAL